jgi:hypothetical protein
MSTHVHACDLCGGTVLCDGPLSRDPDGSGAVCGWLRYDDRVTCDACAAAITASQDRELAEQEAENILLGVD